MSSIMNLMDGGIRTSMFHQIHGKLALQLARSMWIVIHCYPMLTDVIQCYPMLSIYSIQLVDSSIARSQMAAGTSSW